MYTYTRISAYRASKPNPYICNHTKTNKNKHITDSASSLSWWAGRRPGSARGSPAACASLPGRRAPPCPASPPHSPPHHHSHRQSHPHLLLCPHRCRSQFLRICRINRVRNEKVFKTIYKFMIPLKIKLDSS